MSLLAASLSSADQGLGDWVSGRAKGAGFAADSGPWVWRVGWATGNLATDPALALAERRALDDALMTVAAPGDRLGTFGFEMATWGAKPEVVIGKTTDRVRAALDALPTTPAANSQGGRDVERALLAGAAASPGSIVLVVSPGPSQAPLRGAPPPGEADPRFLSELARLGYRAPERFTTALDVGGKSRSLMASLLLPQRPPEAKSLRSAFPTAPKTAPMPTPEVQTSASGPASKGNAAPWAVLAGLLGLAAGALLARRPMPASSPPSFPEAETAVPVALAAAPDPSLVEWREEATRLRKALDLVAQDLSETSETLRDDVIASGEARQEAHRLQRGLEAWDETAIDYLDAARRAATMEGLSPERRETWAKAARDFARLLRARGLDVVAPEPGEPFVDGLHRAESVVHEPAGGAGRVVECLAWGFRRGDAVIRPASVILSLPSRSSHHA